MPFIQMSVAYVIYISAKLKRTFDSRNLYNHIVFLLLDCVEFIYFNSHRVKKTWEGPHHIF